MSSPNTQAGRDYNDFIMDLASEYEVQPEEIKEDERGLYFITIEDNGSPEEDGYWCGERKVYVHNFPTSNHD